MQGQTLTASSGSWAGTTPLTFVYQWMRCNQSGAACGSIASATGQTYAVAAADVGSTLRVQVSATNTAGSAQMLSDATSVVAAAAAPVNTSAPALSGSAQLAQTLTVSTGSWSGQPAPTYAYQWQRCDPAGSNCVNIAAATAPSYTVVVADVGDRLQALVTATNSAGTASKASNQTAAVTSPPSNTAAPTVSGTPTVGQTLSASNGSWSGLPTPTLAYQWQRCDSAGNNCADISGATGQTYALTSSDANHRLRAVVTASNSAGSASASSSPTTVIAAAAAPSNTSRPTISGAQIAGQTLTANPGGWNGTAPITYAYQWQLCSSSGTQCTNISGATGQTLALNPSYFDHRLQVLVTASNSAGVSGHLSGQTSLVQSAPANSAQPTLFGTAAQGKTLSLGTGVWTGSLPMTFSYQWQRCDGSGGNCQNIPGATGHDYTLGSSDVGGQIQALVTAVNTLGSTSRATPPSAPVAATVSAPSWSALPSILGLPLVGQTLQVSNTGWTDLPALAFAYQWQRCPRNATNCSDIPGATTGTYRVGSSDMGRALRVLVTAANTAGKTTVASQRTVAVISPKPQRLVLAVRALKLPPSHARIRLALSELRGQFNTSLWLELDAWQYNRWRPITTTRVARQTTKLLAFRVQPTRSRARISISWSTTTNHVKAATYLAGPNSLCAITAPT